MVAGPFFFLLFGLMEICIIFIISTVMEQAAEDAARAIRTGSSASADGGALQAEVCTGMLELFNCTNALRVQVDSPADFDTVPPLDFSNADGTLKDQVSITYDTGAGDDYVVIRVILEWSLITPIISQSLSNFGTNSRLIQATVVFQNEPF